MMTNMGFDASGVSLTEAQQMVATARASMQGSLPASSSQGPTTIDTTFARPPDRSVDDEIPLTLLQHQSIIVEVDESTDTARAATAIVPPLPLSPTLHTTAGELEQVPQDTVTATGSTTAAKAPPA
eukprot:4432732-Amphidinium_carterae.1